MSDFEEKEEFMHAIIQEVIIQLLNYLSFD